MRLALKAELRVSEAVDLRSEHVDLMNGKLMDRELEADTHAIHI